MMAFVKKPFSEKDIKKEKIMTRREELRAELASARRKVEEYTAKEREIRRELTDLSNQPARESAEYRNYQLFLENLRRPVEDPLVVYQGEPGAFSEMAAIDFFGDRVRTEGRYWFEDAFKALKEGRADYAVLPIENSSTGAIRQVYDLLVNYECYFVGETTVEVSQNLVGLPGTDIGDITTVYSHEQGLFQSERFLNDHPDWKRVPQADTAGSAKMVAELKDPHFAAICSKRAAEIYGLEVLAERINHNGRNTTHFVVISPRPEIRRGSDKVCVSLHTRHEAGSLHEVLSVFKFNRINMIKLESRPVIGHNWEYMFFIDFSANLDDPDMDEVILQLVEATTDLRILGNFASNMN